jgi:hypothetical protein
MIIGETKDKMEKESDIQERVRKEWTQIQEGHLKRREKNGEGFVIR